MKIKKMKIQAMKNKKLLKTKRFITFIELLIAMVLTSLVLTFLFYFYRDIDWLNQDMEKSQKSAFRLAYVQNRLADVLSHAVSPRTNEGDFFFYVSQDANGLLKATNPSLVFTYDFGANRDPQFANHVLGRLYISTNGHLCLATLPSPARWPAGGHLKMKNEILMENVESLSFAFYVPPQKENSQAGNRAPKGKKQAGAAVDIQPKDSWHSDWKSDYNQLPAMVKVILKIKNREEPLVFVYPLPLSNFVIVYDK
jgi:type II secretory pathway component PulJ